MPFAKLVLPVGIVMLASSPAVAAGTVSAPPASVSAQAQAAGGSAQAQAAGGSAQAQAAGGSANATDTPAADPTAPSSPGGGLGLGGATPADATERDINEAPPPLPRKKGVVLDSSLGAHGFAGEFGKVAPPGFWLHTQLGYELLRWLMLFAEGDLYFTDTSRGQDDSKARAFPIFGFGAGPRFTAHITERVAIYAQGSAGFGKADIATNALKILGFPDAEKLGFYFGGRIGIEYYQVNRHLALGLRFGMRDATNFKKSVGSDLPLSWDAGVALRYTF
ncbi:hypothetical protein [Pendulispora albinea]|uniref:Outer membrane protein beta-barrel domain-containing protein n=1 Tax=Pendulispora albinea TaxID=2741071 RepID=A0ABZ2LUR6_9BACT